MHLLFGIVFPPIIQNFWRASKIILLKRLAAGTNKSVVLQLYTLYSWHFYEWYAVLLKRIFSDKILQIDH